MSDCGISSVPPPPIQKAEALSKYLKMEKYLCCIKGIKKHHVAVFILPLARFKKDFPAFVEKQEKNPINLWIISFSPFIPQKPSKHWNWFPRKILFLFIIKSFDKSRKIMAQYLKVLQPSLMNYLIALNRVNYLLSSCKF